MGPLKFVGFCFVLFAAFGAGYYYSNLSDAEPFLAYAEPVSAQECEVPQTIVAPSKDYCAILTMPKSLVPFLERLKRNKLARGVVITPATIDSENGRLTAVAKTSAGPEKIAGSGDSRAEPIEETDAEHKDSTVLGALAVYFLAGSKRQESP